MLDIYRDWLVTSRRKPDTIRIRLLRIRQLEEAFADVLALTTSDLHDFIERKDWKPETINSAVASYRIFYRWAVKKRFLEESPADDLSLVPVSRGVVPMATDAQIIAALRRCTNDRERLMLMLGAELGLRRAEIAAVHTDDREGEFLHVVGKGSKAREQHCPPRLLALLDKIEGEQGEGYYMPGRFGGHVSVNTVYDTIERILSLNPHSLRHRAGTTVYHRSGNDLRLAQEFLGHKDPLTTAKYVHMNRSDLMRASAAAELDWDDAVA